MNRRLVTIVGGALLAASTIGGYLVLGGGDGNELKGAITVYPAAPSDSCDALTGFTDITAGAAVKVTDGTGAVLATTELRSGQQVAGGAGCRFGFDLGDVAEAPLVQISVGERQGLSLTAEQLAAADRTVELRLGGVHATTNG